MTRAIDRWTTTVSLALVFGALVACKKKTDAPAPEASATAAATVAAAASAAPPVASIAPTPVAVDAGVAAVAAPEVGAVTRFPDKEKVATGAVKVTLDDSKVYDEPDNTKPSVASLSKDLFVVRLATLGSDWILVDFPSGVGKLSPGWIEAKSLGAEVHPITKAAVAAQSASATPAAPPSAKPATTAATSAKPATPAAPATTAALAPTVAPPAPPKPKAGAALARPHK
jgi:hypothetical protein